MLTDVTIQAAGATGKRGASLPIGENEKADPMPEKTQKPIQNVIPVWWELKTTTDDGLQLNDFSFSEIKPLLIDAL